MPSFGPAEPAARFTVLLAAWSAGEAELTDLARCSSGRRR